MAVRQAIGGGFPFPAYLNETAMQQRVATGGLYANETSSSTPPPTPSSTHLLILINVGT